MTKPASAPDSDGRVLSGKRARFEPTDEEGSSPDSVGEVAEREGKLLARIAVLAQREALLLNLIAQQERTIQHLTSMIEQLAKAAVHTAPTNPPPSS